MKASVIITTYRRNQFLIKAIESCLNQDFNEPFEIIVVDDNGQNSEYQKENKLALDNLIETHKIKYIALEENTGACRARNAGVAAASGEYIFFLDDDDTFLPAKIRMQTAFLDSNTEYAAHASAFVKQKNGENIPSPDNKPVIGNLKNFLMHGNFYTPMLCIRKSAYVAVGGFRDIPKFQDMYFMLFLLADNHNVYSDNTPMYILNEHDEERISNQSAHNATIAAGLFNQFVTPRRDMFDNEEWKSVQVRLLLLQATSFYSAGYINRLKSVRLWIRCYKLSHDKKYLIDTIKSFIPYKWIKQLERNKSRNIIKY